MESPALTQLKDTWEERLDGILKIGDPAQLAQALREFVAEILVLAEAEDAEPQVLRRIEELKLHELLRRQ